MSPPWMTTHEVDDLLTKPEREFVERLRNEYLGLYQGITLLTIIDRLAPKPKDKT